MDHKAKIIIQADGRAALFVHESFLLFFKKWTYIGEFTSAHEALKFLHGEEDTAENRRG